MSSFTESFLAGVKAKNAAEPEFLQAVEEVADSLGPVLERHPEYRNAKVLQRMVEPERVLMFRVLGPPVPQVSRRGLSLWRHPAPWPGWRCPR